VKNSFDVIVSGVLCLDMLPLMEHLPLASLASPGKLSEVGPLVISTGGAVSNTGLALHRLGINVGLMASVGDDLIGRATVDFLNSRDPVLTKLVTVEKDRSSSYTLVLSPERVDRLFLHCTGVNSTFTAQSVDYESLSQAKIFHLGYPPTLPRLYEHNGAELVELMRRAKETGVITSMDMTLPDANGASGRANWGIILEKVLPYTDIFIPSLEEAMYMLRRSDYERWDGQPHQHISKQYVARVTSQLIEMGVAVAGVKLGPLGIFIQTADQQRLQPLTQIGIDLDRWSNASVYHPAYEVEVAGTVGAGDAAYAGFLASMIRGGTPDDAARWACAVGASNVEQADSTSGVQSWDDTLQRLNSGWQQKALQLDGS
jgi:sugar/nucleoside kinase (ribokinase family)